MPLRCIAEPLRADQDHDQKAPGALVDIVAVHGLEEDLLEAWTDPATRTLWLRDLLPSSIHTARILTFGYSASALSFYGHGAADRIQQHAQTLVADLQADRSLEDCSRRPIIFICHGLGGILVKKALAYSSTKTSKLVEHLYSIFVSTFAILFFGTPHLGVDTNGWSNIARKNAQVSKRTPGGESQLLAAIHKQSETLEAITEQFTPLKKQFHIFYLWEQEASEFGEEKCFVVDEMSAAPSEGDTERSGIYADHTQMVRFSDPDASSYRTVLEALVRYCKEAPPIIAGRWNQATAMLSQVRSHEAVELAGMAFDVHRNNLPFTYDRRDSERTQNKYFDIPQVVSSFYTGREDASRIVSDSLFSPRIEVLGQQRRFMIHGVGGSGKTQFCSKFAQDHRARYWGIFWIDATSAETAKQSYAKIGKFGGMEATQSAGKHWLSNLEQPWLLIINNADEPSLDLNTLFPEGERGHVLVTTRNPDFRVHATVGSIEFKGLEEEDALLLLLRAAAIPEPWDSATQRSGNKITNTLGYLALALVQAGALILQKICGIKNYLDVYHEHRKRLSERRLEESDRDHDQFTIYATWDLSLKSLELRRTEASTDAAQMLSIVGFFHFERIKVEIFTRALSNRRKATEGLAPQSFLTRLWAGISTRLRPPFVLPEFLRQESSNPVRIRKALHELHSFSLITYDGRDDSFSLHPVVHTWARDRLQKGLQRLWAHISVGVLTEAILLPPEDVGESDKSFRRDILPHLDSALSSCPAQIFDYASRFGGLRFPFAVVLQNTWLLVFREQILKAAKCGYVYAERGRFHEAAELLSSVKDALVMSRGYRNDSTIRAMLALSAVYWGLGRLDEAVSLQKIVVDARTKAYGPNHHETLTAMDQLGRSFWLNGQYMEAIELQEMTRKRMQASLGPQHLDTLSAMDNLGVTYGSWYRYAESRAIHEQVLKARTKLLGEHDESTLNAMNNLAMALKDLGKLEEARHLMEEVYKERKSQLGKEHPWTLWALCNLAKVHTELKHLDIAEDMLVPGIAAAKRSLSEDHLGVLMGEGELARVLARQGRPQEAEKLMLSVLPRIEASRGLHHPDVLYTLYKLAQLYEQMDDPERAVSMCALAAERIDDRLTDTHPLAHKIRNQLKRLRKGSESEHATDARDAMPVESETSNTIFNKALGKVKRPAKRNTY